MRLKVTANGLIIPKEFLAGLEEVEIYREGDFIWLEKADVTEISKEVRVESLEWLSEEGKEAILYISDGPHSCLVYAHPCDLIPGDLINQPLLALPYQPVIVKSEALEFKKMRDYFNYEITAKVINLKEELVKVGSIIIKLRSDLPGDTVEGDIVNFVCERLYCMD